MHVRILNITHITGLAAPVDRPIPASYGFGPQFGCNRATDMIITVDVGDITLQTTDVIVNAANASLLGGGGVDGAIHRAAGPELLEACRALNGCNTGDAKWTPGFRLSAKYVVHTVGPVYQDGASGEPELLSSCYQASLTIAESLAASSIAFPAISTGVYGYPVQDATKVAVATVAGFEASTIQSVVFVCFDRATSDVYHRVVAEHHPG